MQDESENTLRTIFGSEFTETLSKEIFAQLAGKISSRNIDAYINQPIPLEMEDILLTPEPPSNVIGNDLPINNNNFYEHSILCQSNSFGEINSYKIHVYITKNFNFPQILIA